MLQLAFLLFPLFGVEFVILQVARPCASSLCATVYSVSFVHSRITSLHRSFSCAYSLPSFMFSLLHLSLSFSVHNYSRYFSLASLIVSLIFATPALARIASIQILSILFPDPQHFHLPFFLINLVQPSPGPVSHSHMSE